MVFKGEVLSVMEMIRLAEEAPPAPVSSVGVIHTAAGQRAGRGRARRGGRAADGRLAVRCLADPG